jgi:hypothetical protein
MNKRPKEQVVADIEAVSKPIKERMDAADPMWLGLLPTESDWATPEEREKLHNLKLELPSIGEERQAARERLKAKILARKNKNETH